MFGLRYHDTIRFKDRLYLPQFCRLDEKGLNETKITVIIYVFNGNLMHASSYVQGACKFTCSHLIFL